MHLSTLHGSILDNIGGGLDTTSSSLETMSSGLHSFAGAVHCAFNGMGKQLGDLNNRTESSTRRMEGVCENYKALYTKPQTCFLSIERT